MLEKTTKQLARKTFFSGSGDPVASEGKIVQLLRDAPTGMTLTDLSTSISSVRNDDLRRYVVRLLDNGVVRIAQDPNQRVLKYTLKK